MDSSSPIRRSALRCSVAALLAFAGTGPARAGTYDTAMSRAASLEQEGRFDEAAESLSAIAPDFGEDYALHLYVGWLRFRGARYEEAERAYARASELSDGSVDARLGLAWSRLKLGRAGEAEDGFESVLADAPENASAREGLALAGRNRPVRVSLSLLLTGHAYQGNPSKAWALGSTLGAGLTAWDHLLAGATYRFGAFFERGGGQGKAQGGGASKSAFSQHEAYAVLGAVWPEWGVTGHYAFLRDGSGYVDNAHVLGLTGRYSPFGDILLSGSASLYDDATIGRFELCWRVPVALGFSLRPAFAVQVAGDGQGQETHQTGYLTAAWASAGGSVWLGGKYGAEHRPAYLSQPAVYDIEDDILYGTSVGGAVRVGGGFSLTAEYEWARYRRESGASALESNAHFVTIGVAWSQQED